MTLWIHFRNLTQFSARTPEKKTFRQLDNFPIPKTKDVLATLGGGERLTRLDMSQATYQQMTLEEVSRKFITINTHNMLSLQQLRWKAYRTPQHLKTLHRQHSSVHFRNAELLYHCFLPDIATVLQPLHKLLRQGTTWFLKKEQQKAFEEARSDA